MWVCPEFSVGASQKHEPHLNQVNINNSAYSKTSTAVSSQSAYCKRASSFQIPTVCFDLGNEWDDWGDFDDDHLVHASEASLASCTAYAEAKVQQSVDNKMTGRVLTQRAAIAMNLCNDFDKYACFMCRLCHDVTSIPLSLTSPTLCNHCLYTSGVRLDSYTCLPLLS